MAADPQARVLEQLNAELAETMIQNEELRSTILDLQNVAERFTRLFESAPTAYLSLDRAGFIRQANPAARELIGREAAGGEDFGRFVRDRYRGRLAAHLRKVFGDQAATGCDLQVTRRDQTSFDARLESRYVPENGLCHTTITDLSGIREAEREAVRARRFSERVLDTAGLPLAVLDGGLVVVAANAAFLSLFARDAQAAVGTPIGEAIGGAWNRGRLLARLRRVLATGEAAEPVEESATFGRAERRTLLFEARPLHDPYGGSRLVLAVRDLTEPLEAIHGRRRLAETRERLEDYTRALSHDVGGALRAIETYAEWLLQDLGPGFAGSASGALESIRRSAVEAAAVIRGLLELSDVDRLRPEPVDLDLKELLAEVAARAPRGRAGEVSLVGPSVKMHTDPDLLRIVFGQLVANGLAFNDSPVRRVEVGWAEGGDRVAVTVRDNGVGIAPAYHEAVFRPFHRLDGSGRRGGGPGIGLALVRRAAERLGGTVSVDSRPGAGSAFTVHVPHAWQEEET